MHYYYGGGGGDDDGVGGLCESMFHSLSHSLTHICLTCLQQPLAVLAATGCADVRKSAEIRRN